MSKFHEIVKVVHSKWKTSLYNDKDTETKFLKLDEIIKQYNVDSIINFTDNNLTNFVGENSIIYQYAGSEYENQCKKLAPVSSKSINTTGYNLNIQHILHLIGPNSNEEKKQEIFEEAFIECIKLANRLKVKTLLIPTIGYSIYELYTFDLAKTIISVLKQSFQSGFEIKQVIFLTNSDYRYNLYEILVNIPDKLQSVFIDFSRERIQKIHKLQNNLTKSISRLDSAKNKIEEKNKLLLQQKEEITIQNELLHSQKEEIISQNEQLQNINTKIETQRDELQEKNKNIKDSINYAKRIQQAVFPTTKSINAILPEYFILFKPQNIVSGDFYWIHKTDDKIIVAAADCTGHGVPGAFMSMLGISFLNQIVLDNEYESSGDILNILRNNIKNALHQNDSELEQTDGLDIALCIIDIENLSLQYSGAYNPLYLIRKTEDITNDLENFRRESFEDKSLLDVKADRQPIAIHMVEKPFTTKYISLCKGDLLYLFSDGFIDQSGGKDYKKFLSKNFRKLLLSLSNHSLDIQKEQLTNTLEDWMNGYEQVDDILVIGVKI